MPVISRTKVYVTMPDYSVEEFKKVISVSADGVFSIPLPEHIAAVSGSLDPSGQMNKTNGHDTRLLDISAVSGVNKEAVDAQFMSYLRAYKEWIESSQAERYIKVIFKSNVCHVEGFHDAPGTNRKNFVGYGSNKGDISFAGAPALELHTEEIYKIGDDFFSKSPRGHYSSRRVRDDDKIIRYTPERQSFFDNMEAGLTNFICRITEFFEDMEGNTDLAIASGNDTLLLTSD